MFALLQYLYSLIFGSPSPPELKPYQFPDPTTQELDYAELAIVDLSLAATPEGRLKLAEQVTEAMHTAGFFYCINHGYNNEEMHRIFSIGNMLFDDVSLEDKKKYSGTDSEVYEGYKPKSVWRLADDVHDQIEHYNIHRKVHDREHPEVIRGYLKELEDFTRNAHMGVLYPILRIMALALELPEDTLVKQHAFEATGHTSARFMKYYPRTQSDESKTKNVWLKGHTDIGSVTMLWSQPVSGLQILTRDGQWKWVRHIENAMVINSGDALGFLCGGYFPPTIHRVIQPPTDQHNKQRLGLFYFAMPNDDVVLEAHKDSPVLRRLSLNPDWLMPNPTNMGLWRRDRTKSYGHVDLVLNEAERVETEIIAGVKVKHWL